MRQRETRLLFPSVLIKFSEQFVFCFRLFKEHKTTLSFFM